MALAPLTRTTAFNLRSIVAIPTCFAANGLGPEDAPIDYDAQQTVIEHLLVNGVQAIVAAGTTGEAATMTHEEQIEFIGRVVEIVNGRVPVIAGAGSNCTRESLQLVNGVMSAGASGVLVVMPYYNKPTPEGQYAHYARIAETGAPVMLYSVAGRTGRPLDLDVAERLWYDFENVIGIKQADSDRLEDTLRRGLRVWLGNDDDISPWMFNRGNRHSTSLHDEDIDPAVFRKPQLNLVGVVSVVGNVLPHQITQLVTHWRRIHETGSLTEKQDRALDSTLRQIEAMSAACFEYTNPIGVKTMLVERGLLSAANFRLPLCPLNESQRREVSLLSEKNIEAIIA